MNEAQPDPCLTDFAEHIRHLFVDIAQGSAISTGVRPVRRAVFRKTHGVVVGRMVLFPERPKELREGVFGGDSYDAWLRFSSDVAPDGDDAKNGTIGIGIKLFGLKQPTLAEVDPNAPTADLVLQNHDVFFVDTGHDMCVFTNLALKGQESEWYKKHPETKQILADMSKREESVLTATYWSILPYSCGSKLAVKYRLRPEQGGSSQAPDGNPNRLRADLANRVKADTAAFLFEIQVPREGTNLLTDKGTERWTGADAPFIPVAQISIPVQDINTEGQETYGDNLTFSPWRVPWANRPLGSLAEARRRAYPSSAHTRHNMNGVPNAEPHLPRQM